jgi:hypothetical protein
VRPEFTTSEKRLADPKRLGLAHRIFLYCLRFRPRVDVLDAAAMVRACEGLYAPLWRSAHCSFDSVGNV